MRGRAHQLFQEFRIGTAASAGPFGVSRVILLARVVPEHLTPELDDPDVEARLERAIEKVRAQGASLERREPGR
jgi:hypothetical protein